MKVDRNKIEDKHGFIIDLGKLSADDLLSELSSIEESVTISGIESSETRKKI